MHQSAPDTSSQRGLPRFARRRGWIPGLRSGIFFDNPGVCDEKWACWGISGGAMAPGATILSIWQGTPHRQSLDGLEPMERKGGDRLLFQHVAPTSVPQALEEMASRVEDRLALPAEEREANVQEVPRDLAVFTADALSASM